MEAVTYLINQNLTDENLERFGFNYWRERGIEVIVIDVTPMLCQAVYDEQRAIQNKEKVSCYIRIDCVWDIYNNWMQLKKVQYYFDLCFDHVKLVPIKCLLKFYGAKRIIDRCGYLPNATPGVGINKIISKLKTFGYAWALKKAMWSALMQLASKYYKPEYVIASGSQSIDGVKSRGVIWAHSFDYDKYLKVTHERNSIPAGGGIVFIDQDICDHEDFKYLNLKPYANRNNYYPAINILLKTLRDELNSEVKVALHPRRLSAAESAYDPIFFQFKNATCELISNADVVIGHNSTAIQLAVIFEKKILLVTTDELNERVEASGMIYELASLLGLQVINADKLNISNDLCLGDLDKERRTNYINRYIKKIGSAELPIWAIVDNVLFGEINEGHNFDVAH